MTASEPTGPNPIGPEPELVGTQWQLVQFTRNGRITSIPADIDSVLRLDGKGSFWARACNYASGDADVDGQRVVLRLGVTTAMACQGLRYEVEQAVFGTMHSGPLEWMIDRRRLVLRAGNGDTLVYQVRASIYPNQLARTIAAGERDHVQYRVAITDTDGGTAVLLDVRADPESGWAGGMMIGTPISVGDGLETVLFEKVNDEYIVTGVAPSDAVRIVHHDPISGTNTDLAHYRVDEVEWGLFVGFVPSHTNSSLITAYNAAGDVVATWSRQP